MTSPGARTGLPNRSLAGLIAVAIGVLVAPGGALADSWAPGPLSTYEHLGAIGVELSNGQVLAAGGLNGSVDNHGELLAADGSVFTPAGTMVQGRFYDAATRLPNGDVLIAGGDNSTVNLSPALKTAELWSPTGGGTFTMTGSMHVARQALTLTTLPDGQVLAVGGSPVYKPSGGSAGSRTAELYNPATQKWTLTGSMPSGRLGHTATLLPNCKVLIVGDAPTSVLYNYATGTFSTAGSEGSFQRSYQSATLMPNGKVLIAGGENALGQALNTASVYNPTTGRFTPTANTMSAPHNEGFGNLLSDGRVIVGGGTGGNGGQGVTAVDIYDPSTNHWSPTASLPPAPFAFAIESATLQNGDVALIGPGSSPKSTEIFTPSSTGSASPPAQNCNDLFSILSAASAAQGKLTVRIAVPFGGSLHGVATVPAQSGVPKSVPYGSASVGAGHSGVWTLTVSPGPQAKGLLKSKGTLKVSVAVTYTQPGKSALHKTKSVVARWA